MKTTTSAGACRCCGTTDRNHHRAGCDLLQWAAACERAHANGQRHPGLTRFREQHDRIVLLDEAAEQAHRRLA